MPNEYVIAKANINVKTLLAMAANRVIKPISSKPPKPVSKIVAVIARKGIRLIGANEFTSPVYFKNFSQPDECCPQRLNRLATLDKKPAASVNLSNKVATSFCVVIISFQPDYDFDTSVVRQE